MSVTEDYYRQHGAAWDDPDQAAAELEELEAEEGAVEGVKYGPDPDLERAADRWLRMGKCGRRRWTFGHGAMD